MTKAWLIIVFIVMTSVVAWPQEAPRDQSDSVVNLKVVREIPVSPPSTVQLLPPTLCSSSGNIIVWPNVESTPYPIAISANGQIVARFQLEKTGLSQRTDVVQPRVRSVFLRDDGVYELISASVLMQPGYFVAQFRADGSFVRLVQFSVPFEAIHFGVFGTGDFLVAGTKRRGDQFAIVSSKGQLIRSIEMKHAGKVTRSPWEPEIREMNPGPYLYSGRVVENNENLFYFQSWDPQAVLFSVTSEGVVTDMSLALPNGYGLGNVRRVGGQVIVEARKFQARSPGDASVSIAFDAHSGDPVWRYSYPQDLSFGSACPDGKRFRFLVVDPKDMAIKMVIAEAK